MEWVTLTETDLLAVMTSKERVGFGTADTDVSVADRVTPILANLVAEIRGKIASHPANRLSVDPTKIPASFKGQALALVRWSVLTSIPGYKPGDARKTDYDTAIEFFRDVAKGIIRPEPADDAVTSALSQGITLISNNERQATRNNLRGL